MSLGRAIGDPWDALRRHTAARIALGRAGGSLPTSELLKFSYDHAQAKDAVHAELDLDRLETELVELGLPIVRVGSRVSDRLTYLQRPDLGGELDDPSRSELEKIAKKNRDGYDIVVIVADGLSATAAQVQAATVVGPLV